MEVEFKQTLSKEDYINFNVQHHLLTNKIRLLFFPVAGVIIIILYITNGWQDDYTWLPAIFLLLMPLIRYYGIRSQASKLFESYKILGLATDLKFEMEEFSESDTLHSTVMKYDVIYDIKETAKYIFIYLSVAHALIIVKEQLSDDQQKTLKQILAIKHPKGGLLKEIN